MKQLIITLLMTATVIAVQAQDVQLHYDLGRNLYPSQEAGRPKVTLTLEQFKADPWGSWYYFVDVDFSRKFTEAAYAEVSREYNLGTRGLAAHVEYNGGLNRGGSFQQSALAGAAWNGHNAGFTRTWSLQLMYKHYFKSYAYTRSYASVQLTGVWGLDFLDRRLTFSGFIDCWRGEQANGHGQLVILTEPQLWCNLTPHFSVGTEWEVSDRFVYNVYDGQTFFVNPTLAVKWNF